MNKERHALDIAKYIVYRSWEIDKPVTNLRVQYILYILQLTKIQNDELPLFEENFKCCEDGFIIPDVFDYYKEYGFTIIPKTTEILLYNSEKKILEIIPLKFDYLSTEEKIFINAGIDFTLKYPTSKIKEKIKSTLIFNHYYRKKKEISIEILKRYYS